MTSDRFTWERAVLDEPELARADLAILLAFATHAGADLTAYPSRKRLAQVTGYSEGQIGRSIKAAIDLGYLERVITGGRRGDGTTYSSVHRLTLPHARMGARMRSSSAQNEALMRASVTSHARTHARLTLQEQSIEEQRTDGRVVHSQPNDTEWADVVVDESGRSFAQPRRSA